jgi:hypothetical protein
MIFLISLPNNCCVKCHYIYFLVAVSLLGVALALLSGTRTAAGGLAHLLLS